MNMGCLDRLIWRMVGMEHPNTNHTCSCPAPVPFEKLSIKPKFRTPLDKLGFPLKCCFCCPTRLASGFIFLLSLLWAAMELQCADKTMENIFPDRDTAFFYSKMAFVIILMGFILACGSLLVGVVTNKQHFLHCFIWYAFIFNCLMIVFTLGGATAAIMRTGDVTRQQTAKVVFAMLWSIVFFYLLMVVNGYKLKVW